MDKADFACQWLDFYKINIFNKGKQIFRYNHDLDYEINKYGMLDTKIKLGEDIGDEEDEEKYTTMSYPEFEKRGYAIKAGYKQEYFWMPNQRIYYYIIRGRIDSLGITYDAVRKAGLKIQHDPSKRRFRLMGKYALPPFNLRPDIGHGPWIIYDMDSPISGGRPKKRERLSVNEARYILRRKTHLSNENTEYQSIPELPLIMSKEKYIVCVAKHRIPQRFIVTGEPRTGKSLFCNNLSTNIFYKWQDSVGWLIDPQNQFYDISKQQEYSKFIKTNKLINHFPVPVPAVHYYLGCKNDSALVHKNISMKLTLSLRELLNKISFYGYGIKTWQLDGAERYLPEHVDALANGNPKTDRDVKDILYSNTPGIDDKSKKHLKSMFYKWQATLKTIFKEQFTSNVYGGDDYATDELEIEFPDGRRMKGHPFIMSMEAGLMPFINDSHVPDKGWVRNYLADVMEKIVSHQIDMGQKGTRNRTWIFPDEMQSIYEIGRRKDNASNSFIKLFKRGGFQEIGFCGNTQSLDKIEPELLKHSTHICCTHTKSPVERKMIANLFNLHKEDVDQLSELEEQEMMVFSDFPFVIYDRWGRRKVPKGRKWFRGKIIPSPNYHKAPG